MTIPNAPRYPLPRHLSPVRPDFQAVSELSGVVIVAHETDERHVDWGRSQMERLEVQAELVPVTVENLKAGLEGNE